MILSSIVLSCALFSFGCNAQGDDSATTNGFDTLQFSDVWGELHVKNSKIHEYTGDLSVPNHLEFAGPLLNVRNGDTIYNISDSYKLTNIVFISTRQHFYEDHVDFKHWPELRHIYFGGASISQQELNNLLSVPKLRTLYVPSAIAVDSIPSCVCELEHLDTLNLGWMRDIKIPDCLEKNGVVFLNKTDLSQYAPTKHFNSNVEHRNLTASLHPETVLKVRVEGTTNVFKDGKLVADASTIYKAKNLVSLFIKLKTTSHFPDNFDFSKLPELRHFYISSQEQISEELLRNLFTNAPKLTKVSISQHANLDSIPHCICELENLEELSYGGEKQTVKLPKCLAKMKQLKTIRVTSTLDKSIWKMEYLENLFLSNNAVQNISAKIIGLKNLRFLSLGGGSLTKLDPAIALLPKLKRLDLTDVGGLKVLPKFKTGFHSLEDLRILRVPITNIPEFGEAQQLISINIVKTRVAALPELGHFKNLRLLLVEQSYITEIPESIGEASALQAIMLYDNIIKDVPATIANLKNLKVLVINFVDESKLMIALEDVHGIVFSMSRNDWSNKPEFKAFCKANNIRLKTKQGGGQEYWKVRNELGLIPYQ